MTTILSVCTGNICRSPASALLVQEYLGDLADSTSAGTHAMVGMGVPAEMLMNLDAEDDHGIDGRDHVAQQLRSQLVDQADIIIAMTAEHRTEIVQQTPTAVQRTFLLGELAAAARANAELDGATPQERLAHIPEAISWFRPSLAGLDIPDVPDPYKCGQADYDAAYVMIQESIIAINTWVRAGD